VVWAESTVERAAFDGLGSRVLNALAHSAVFLEALVCLVVCPIRIFEVSMLWAVFAEQDLTVSFYDFGVDFLQAFRAEAERMLYDVRVVLLRFFLFTQFLQFVTTESCNI